MGTVAHHDFGHPVGRNHAVVRWPIEPTPISSACRLTGVGGSAPASAVVASASASEIIDASAVSSVVCGFVCWLAVTALRPRQARVRRCLPVRRWRRPPTADCRFALRPRSSSPGRRSRQKRCSTAAGRPLSQRDVRMSIMSDTPLWTVCRTAYASTRLHVDSSASVTRSCLSSSQGTLSASVAGTAAYFSAARGALR